MYNLRGGSSGILRKGRLNLAPSLELISFQNDNFGSQCEAIMTKIQEHCNNPQFKEPAVIAKLPEVKELAELTKKRLGLKVKIITDEELAAVLPFYPNKHHIFLHDFWKGNIDIKEQNAVLDRKNVQEGTVNVEKAKVTGIFSDYTVDVFMCFHDLFKKYKLTVPEVTAVYLHEIGHSFYSCEYSDRLESNNQIIADVFKMATGREDKRDMKYMYRELQKVDKDITEQEVDRLVNGEKIVAGYIWFKLVANSVKAQMSDKTYDKTAFEASADNFTNRFGYGRQIITALDKLHNAGWIPTGQSMIILSYLIQVASVALLLFVIFAILVPMFNVVAIFQLSLALMLLVLGNSSDNRDMTYDELNIRYKRVRNDMVEFLKRNRAVDDAKVKEMVDAIKSVDMFIQKAGVDVNFYNHLSRVFLSKSRAAEASIKEQQFLESLISNDLFIKAAQLRTV